MSGQQPKVFSLGNSNPIKGTMKSENLMNKTINTYNGIWQFKEYMQVIYIALDWDWNEEKLYIF